MSDIEGNIYDFPKPDKAPDPVNNPRHYIRGGVEAIDIIEHVAKDYPADMAYHVGNILKYLIRAPHKGNMRQDLSKATWYLNRANERCP